MTYREAWERFGEILAEYLTADKRTLSQRITTPENDFYFDGIYEAYKLYRTIDKEVPTK